MGELVRMTVNAILGKKGSEWSAEEWQRVREWVCEPGQLTQLYAIARRYFPQEPEGVWNEFFASAAYCEAGTVPPKSRFDRTIDKFDPTKGSFWGYLKMRFDRFCEERMCAKRSKEKRMVILDEVEESGSDRAIPSAGTHAGEQLVREELIKEWRDAILDCWNQLPPDSKEVFALRYLSEDRTYIPDEERAIEEVAQILGISENLVRVRLHRARLPMRRCLKQKGIEL